MTVKEKKPWRQTPLIESSNLSKAAGCRIFLKLENVQPGGSFKSRGIGNYLLCSLKRSANPENVHFYSSSGGNAGLACVHAAKFLGRPATVVVPMSTKPMMIAKVKAAGASEVIQHGVSWKEADTYLKDVIIKKAEESGIEPVYVNPFDHPDIWDGHSTMVDELRHQFSELSEGVPDVIACSVGGGGLFNGIVQGVQAQGSQWSHTSVVAVETEGASSLAQALDKGEHITLPEIKTIATSLGAVRVSERTFELASEGRASDKTRNITFSDAEAAMGCWRFADDERILVEPACGVTAALCYGGRLKRALGRPVRKDEKVVIVVCGGQGVTAQMIEQWRQEYGKPVGEDCMNGTGDGAPSAMTAPKKDSGAGI